MVKALVVLSGGQDSTTCLFWACEQFAEVAAVTFNYGQAHLIELKAALKVAQMANVIDHEVVHVGPVLVGSSPLINGAEPEQYESWSKLPGGLEKTFVPARNALFLVLAANRAYALGCTHIVMGVAQEDFGGYPDCRQSFIDAMQLAMRQALSLTPKEPMAQLQIHTPLMDLDKAATVRLAQTLPGCFDALAYTHTAYDGQYPPTGKDHASLLRAKGFEQVGVPDPLVLRAHREGRMSLPDTSNYKGVS